MNKDITSSEWIKQKFKAFKGQLILFIIAVFIVFAQFVDIGNNIDKMFTFSFWLNVLMNWAILSFIYMVYQTDSITKSLLDVVYLATVTAFEELYKRITSGNHISKIEHYGNIRNEELRRKAYTDFLIGTGIPLSDYYCIYQALGKKEINNRPELTDWQKKKLIRIKKVQVSLSKISLNELATNNNNTLKKKYDEYNEAFSYNEKALQSKLLAIRLVKAAVWAIALTIISFQAKQVIDVMSLITWIILKAIAIFWAVYGGIKDGKTIVLSVKRTCFTKKITFMQRFFEWNANGCPELPEFKPKVVAENAQTESATVNKKQSCIPFLDKA